VTFSLQQPARLQTSCCRRVIGPPRAAALPVAVLAVLAAALAVDAAVAPLRIEAAAVAVAPTPTLAVGLSDPVSGDPLSE